MKASELIKQLQEIVLKYGDHEVYSVDDNMYTSEIDGTWFNALAEDIKISITPMKEVKG